MGQGHNRLNLTRYPDLTGDRTEQYTAASTRCSFSPCPWNWGSPPGSWGCRPFRMWVGYRSSLGGFLPELRFYLVPSRGALGVHSLAGRYPRRTLWGGFFSERIRSYWCLWPCRASGHRRWRWSWTGRRKCTTWTRRCSRWWGLLSPALKEMLDGSLELP